ncbi:exported hypothetical protein [Gammaproteobacteria bacterium]
MKFLFFLPPILLLGAATMPTTAEESLAGATAIENAQALADLCATSVEDPKADAYRSFCYGYLSGAHGFYQSIHGPSPRKKICVPMPRPTRAQAAEGFVAWIKAHPQFAKESPIDALYRFAEQTWPCSDPNPSPSAKKSPK